MLFFGLAASALAYSDELSVSPQLYVFDYREFDQDDRLLDKEHGYLPGVSLQLGTSHDDTRLDGQLAVYSGQVEYDGHTQSGIPHQTDTDTQLLRMGIRLTPQTVNWLPGRLFFGWRYWHWDRDIQTANNVQGLHEIYSWQELELGMYFNSAAHKQSWYWLEAAGFYILNPRMKIRLSSSTPTLRLGSRPGVRLRAGKSWRYSETMDLSFSLFTEYWEFGRSNTIFTNDFFGSSAYLTEPASKSFHSGLELSFISRF